MHNWTRLALRHIFPRAQIRWLSSQDDLCRKAVEALTASLSTKSVSARQKHEKVAAKAVKGATEFYNHFLNVYGADRWPALCEALLRPPRMAALVNPFVSASSASAKDWNLLLRDKYKREIEEHNDVSIERLEWANPLVAYWIDNGIVRIPPPISSIEPEMIQNDGCDEANSEVYTRLRDYYCLDPSSLLPVLALNLGEAGEEPMSVLDMCAAPGGKALCIIQAIFMGHASTISMVVVNEVSDARRKRLRRVLDQYLPPGMVGSSVFVTGRNGVGFGSVKGDISYGVKHEYFSHVLCDVPCSGERHVVQNGRALGDFKPSKSKRNQKRQVALLKAAVAGCHPGGIVVYSTCSIEPQENDAVVEKILSKRSGMIELVSDISFPVGEPTKHGWILLPDHPSCLGLGPMYIAALRRRSN